MIKNVSNTLTDFLNYITELQKIYKWNKNELNSLDKETQDYLHLLELGELNYKERAKLATKLANIRKLRRQSKDTVEVCEPLIEYFNSDKGKNTLNVLKSTLGSVRKIEKSKVNRVYRFKILEKDDLG